MSGGRERLAKLRKEAGYTQQTLAMELKVHRRTVVRWERGSADPQPGLRKRLAEALGVSTEELADVLRAEPHTSGVDLGSSPVAVVEPASGMPALVGAGDVAGSQRARWTRLYIAPTVLAVACGLAVIAGFILLRPGANAGVPAGMAVSTQLVALHSGRCVSIVGDVTENGAKAYQEQCTDEPGRTWSLERAGEGSAPTVLRIVGVDSRRCLTFSEERVGGAQVIVQQTCDPESDAQQWRFVVEQQRDGLSYGPLTNMARGGCLDINHDSVEVGTPVVLWTCGSQHNQRFGVADAAVP
ncbi:MAG: RICIN domain-containing protein [Pseudonocardiaceae bacterium]